jgi:Uma2 family endonuclease
MSPSGARHGQVAAQIIGSLAPYVKKKTLGAVYAAEAGFRIARNPDTVRAPDAAFVRAERVVATPGFFEGPPDAAFEVVSPNDSYTEVDEKTVEWLRAGVRVVVIVDPRTRNINIHRADGAMHATDGIEIDDVIPGWTMSAAEVFD